MATSFVTWYAANKGALNAKRKAAYHADPEIREKAKEQQRNYMAANPRKSKAGDPLFKDVNGVQRQVMRVGEAAVHVGRTEQVLRLWERKGLIPKPTVKSTHRYYTMRQITLMQELSQLIDKVRHRPERESVLNAKRQEIANLWSSD